MNVNRGGLSQTLYNLFCFLPAENILCITSIKAYKISPASEPYRSRYITYYYDVIPVPNNRLANWLAPVITKINYFFNKYFRRFRKVHSAIHSFNPDVIVSCPNGSEGVFMHAKLSKSFKGTVFPYFMDDWLYQLDAGNTIHLLTKKILKENPNWLMISKNLSDILSQRYNIYPRHLLEVHNPVDLTNIPGHLPIEKKDKYTIAYAGALWPMHFDALVTMAKAVQALGEKRNIQLKIYTAQANWDWRKKELRELGVVYGGHVPYQQIHQKLAEADCLLVTASFLPEWETHSRASVQTKLTDYLKAGRLVISCGPGYAANHEFLKKYDCGICIETNNAPVVAEKLDAVLSAIELNEHYIENGFNTLRSEFSFEAVHKELKEFLTADYCQ